MRGVPAPPNVGRMDDILSTHPAKDTFDLPQLRAAIEAAARCASSCATCADACLHGDHVEHMVRCIDLDNQCAEICRTTADVLSRPGPNGDSWEAVVRACIAVCRECAAECGQHEHDHCQMCARDCTACADACEALLAAAD